jgi:hypothetical protein
VLTESEAIWFKPAIRVQTLEGRFWEVFKALSERLTRYGSESMIEAAG